MLTMEASDLATRISQTWPRSGPATGIWEEELALLHHKQAETAYFKIRRVAKSAPSIAEFMDAYQALGGPPVDDSCSSCHGLGWVEVDERDARRHGPACSLRDDPTLACACRAVDEPCRCKAGDRARVQQAAIDRRRGERRAPRVPGDDRSS